MCKAPLRTEFPSPFRVLIREVYCLMITSNLGSIILQTTWASLLSQPSSHTPSHESVFTLETSTLPEEFVPPTRRTITLAVKQKYNGYTENLIFSGFK